MTTDQYDPNWPFPQFGCDGTPLLPPDFDPKPSPKPSWDSIDDLEESPW